jgi:hypothetical protein
VGHASGGTTLDRGTDSWLHRVGRYFADLFELSNGDGASLLDVPRWRFLVFAACAAAVVAVLAARRRRGLAGWIGLGAVLAVLAAPLVITWIGIAHRVGLHLLSAFGIETASLSRLPEGFYESSMHSSYGLAFVLLFLASIALVLVSARRRLVTAVPQLAALAAVPLMVLASSAVLAYDSMRMRYLAFGVALASATFGIVLRVRAVAWIAVGLACVNTAVLVAYFVPRPAGLALLTKNRALDTNARWWVQGNSGNGDPDAFRFLEERVPAAATVALALRFNTYVYPAWDAGLRRTVRFVPEGGDVPASARWLVLGPGKELEERSLAGWKRELASPGGWRIYSR